MYNELDEPFVLYQGAGVGQRWLAYVDGPYRIMAEVTEVDSATVLGLPDEIKRIVFTTERGDSVGGEVVISRRYGLVTGIRFHQVLFERTTYALAGMDAPEAGRQLPEPETYGLAAVGDTFQIESYNYLTEPFGSGTPFARRNSSFTILEVDTTQTGIYAYRARGDFYDYVPSFAGYRAVRLDTVFDFTIDRVPDALTEVQPGQVLISPGSPDRRRVAKSELSEHRCGFLQLRASTPVTFPPGENCGLDDSHVDGGPGPVYTQFVPVPLDSIHGQAGPQWASLRYLSSGDRRCGTFVDPAKLSVSTREPLTHRIDVQLYPNPAGDQITVELPDDLAYDLEVINPTGGKLRTVTAVRRSTVIPTRVLPGGVYILLVSRDGQLLGRRRFTVE
ncbi:T9SS type A sorting domain-containing protein [Lewinella sp. JB7]|uniref:T9SS type A sorting domain-containing protein n=1 Tax=Lewinella sp. JB7 TaxID=2962887 RepID=UPI0020C97760|nr:T9SS type A sorting domain-containing protein [Lewinella sp. JB7]MCP9236593.1 T9SS type A sorting domain-containing protein [Lewinella sp. JB7]